MTITQWLKQATDELADAMFTSPRLDAEIILAHTIRKPRTYLHAHGEETIAAREEEIANARIEIRKDHVPIAYIIGHKEFYGRRFHVSPSVLIPRPESEQLIELIKKYVPSTQTNLQLVDVGTGSGCLGITAKLELPQLNVTLLDTSRHALTVAKRNARLHNASIETHTSNLLASYPHTPDIVLANLPYVYRSWEQSKELQHEPADALYADADGLALIYKCIDECQRRQDINGLLLLEADPRQLDAIAHYATAHNYKEVAREQFALAFKKI